MRYAISHVRVKIGIPGLVFRVRFDSVVRELVTQVLALCTELPKLRFLHLGSNKLRVPGVVCLTQIPLRTWLTHPVLFLFSDVLPLERLGAESAFKGYVYSHICQYTRVHTRAT